MMNAFKFKTKRCCSAAHERLMHQLGACEKESNSFAERHACFRKAAKASGRRARACMAEGNS